MSGKRKGGSFIKQAAILAGASLLVRFIGFLYRPPMTAMIGDEGNAIYAAGYQVYNFLLILSSAGLPAAIGKMVAERIALKQYRNAHNVFRVALYAASGIGFVFMILLIVLARPIADNICKIPGAYYTLVSLAPTVFIVAIMSVYRGYFQGMRTMVPTAISQVVEQIFNASASLILAYTLVKHSVALGAAGGTSGTGIGALMGLLVILFSYNIIKPDIHNRMEKERFYAPEESSRDILKVLFSTAMPIIIGTAIYSITNLADMSMVMSRLLASGAFSENEATALYGQLQGKYVVLTTLPVAISTAMATAAVPNIAAAMAVNDIAGVKRKINTAIRIAMIISIPAAVGMGVLADEILMLLFPSVPSGGNLLRVGSAAIIFLALSQIVTGTLQGIGRVKDPAISAAFGGVVKIILNYFLIVIPGINVVGAVISTIACYIVASTLNILALFRATGVKPDFLAVLLKPTIAAGVMGLCCYGTNRLIFTFTESNAAATLFAIVIGMIAYSVIMYAIKGITKADISLIPGGKKINEQLIRMKI